MSQDIFDRSLNKRQQAERASVTDGSPTGRDVVVRRWLDSRQPGPEGYAAREAQSNPSFPVGNVSL